MQENSGPDLLNLKKENGHLDLRNPVISNKQGGMKKFKAMHIMLMVCKSLQIQTRKLKNKTCIKNPMYIKYNFKNMSSDNSKSVE